MLFIPRSAEAFCSVGRSFLVVGVLWRVGIAKKRVVGVIGLAARLPAWPGGLSRACSLGGLSLQFPSAHSWLVSAFWRCQRARVLSPRFGRVSSQCSRLARLKTYSGPIMRASILPAL